MYVCMYALCVSVLSAGGFGHIPIPLIKEGEQHPPHIQSMHGKTLFRLLVTCP